MGIVGMGRIGQAIAKRALAFGMSIAYTARSAKPELPFAFHATPRELAAASDFLVLIAPGGAATRKMIDASVLEALGPKGYLVNVARGSVSSVERVKAHALPPGATSATTVPAAGSQELGAVAAPPAHGDSSCASPPASPTL